MKKRYKAMLFIAAMLCCTSSPLLGVVNLVNTAMGNDVSASFDTPTMETSDNEIDNGLNSAAKKLFDAKQVIMDKVNLTIDLDDTDPENVLYLKLSNLDMDFTEMNILNLNLSTDVELIYKAIDETFSLRYDSNDYLCITYRNNSFKFHIPSTLSDVFNILNSIGINITDSSNLSSSLDLTSLLDEIKSINAVQSVSSTDSGGYIYLAGVDDYTMDSTKISNLAFQILADNEDNPVGLKTNPSIVISDTDATKSGNIKITLDASIKTCSESSTYDKSTSAAYLDVTDANHSILSTVSDIFCGNYTEERDESGKKKSQVKVNIDAEISVDSDSTDSLGNKTQISKKSILTGSLQADLTDVFQDHDSGEYSLSLSHKANADAEKSYNDIYAYYVKGNTYLSLNNVFKGKISNSSIKDLFSTISDLTSLPSFKSVTDDFNFILQRTEAAGIGNLVGGDYSGLYDIFESYSYSPSGFSVSINADSIGLEEGLITVSVNLAKSGTDTYMKDITVTGLSLGSVSIDKITLSLDDFGTMNTPVGEYSDFHKSVDLFDNVSDLISAKEATASYSLLYTDQNNVTYAVDGKLGMSLASENVFTDNDDGTETLHTGEGEYYLSFDLPQEENDKYNNNAVGQGIEMYYADHNLYFGYEYYKNAKYSLTSSGDHYVFRNSITNTELDTMYQLINKKVSGSSDNLTSSLTGMSDFISAIVNSSKLQQIKDGINDYSLKELDGVLSLATDENDNIQVTIDPASFLVNTSFASNTSSIVLALSTDAQITELSVNGTIDGNKLQFTMDFSAYQSLDDLYADSENPDYHYTDKFTTENYSPLTDGEAILDSAFAIPTDLQKFDLGVTATVTKNTDTPILKLDSGSGASVDLTEEHDKASGVVLIKHPDLNDTSSWIDDEQKIEFNYQELDTKITREKTGLDVWNGEFLVEYNDNMHVKAQNKDVFDIIDKVSAIDDSNLLYRYLRFTKDSTLSSGSALMDLIEGKTLSASKILEYPYFQSLTFDNNGKITLGVDPRFITDSAQDGSEATIEVLYANQHITGVNIKATFIQNSSSTYNIEASLTLTPLTSDATGAYERNTTDSSASNYVLPYSDADSSKFVDVAGFETLIDCLIDTTENNYFEMSGTLEINIPILLTSIEVKTECHAQIYVENNQAYAYLRFNTTSGSDYPEISEEDYHVSEFFITEDEVICNQTTTSKESPKTLYYQWQTQAVAYKTTKDNLVEYLVYYLLDYIMNLSNVTMGSTLLEEIYSGSSSSDTVTIKHDFSKVINEAVYNDTDTFTLDLSIGSLISLSTSIINLDNTTCVITVKHDNDSSTGKKPLKSIALDIKVSLSLGSLDIINVNVSSSSGYNTFSLDTLANIDGTTAQNEDHMARYYNFKKAFNQNYDSTGMEPYLITGISEASNPSYTGSTSVHKYTSDSKFWSAPSYNLQSQYSSDIYIFVW